MKQVEAGPHLRGPEGAGHLSQVDGVLLVGGGPGDGAEDAVLGAYAVTAQVEGPVHGEENVVVDHVGVVVGPRLGRVQRDVDDLGNPEASAPVGPDHLVLVELGREVTKGVSNVPEFGHLGGAKVAAGPWGEGHIIQPSQGHTIL